MARYYLIPVETDADKMRHRIQPAYLDLIQEFCIAERARSHGIIPQGDAKHYIVVLPDKGDATKLEAAEGVVKLDDSLSKAALQTAGADVSKLGTTPTKAALENAVSAYVTGQERSLDSFNHARAVDG
jgi:hypothetical protein